MSDIPEGQKFTTENAAEMGAKGGHAKKGSKHLSTLIREIGENIDWDKTTLKNKEQMKELYGNNGWKAIVYVAITKAMAGDTKAMDWLSKNGYGTKIDMTLDGDINVALVEFIGNNPDDNQDQDTNTD